MKLEVNLHLRNSQSVGSLSSSEYEVLMDDAELEELLSLRAQLRNLRPSCSFWTFVKFPCH